MNTAEITELIKKFDCYCKAHDCETCPIHKNGKCAYLCGVKDGHFTEELFQEIMGYTPNLLTRRNNTI